jgi:hypothetical protein
MALKFTGFTGWEDARKVMVAAIVGASAVLLPELTNPNGLHFTRQLLNAVVGAGIAAAIRVLLALFETPSIPVDQVSKVKLDAQPTEVQKLVDEKIKTDPLIQPVDVKAQ